MFVFGVLRPVYTGDFCCDFAAISNRPCKLLATPQRFESPVVTRREIVLEIAAKIAAKIAANIASENGPLVM